MMEQELKYNRWLLLHKLNTSSVFNNNFRALKTDEDRFSLALGKVVNHSANLLDSDCKRKTFEHSVKLREVGNKSFRNAQYYKAVQEYTESIVHAVDSSKELALAYANRSAALFKLEKYADCVNDINRAQDLQYPDKLKAKLYKRKGLCLKLLGRSGAQSSFEQALSWLDKMDLSINEISQFKRELHEYISSIGEIVKPQNIMGKHTLPRLRSSNLEIPCASNAVALKHSIEFGRHLVATRKIKSGEILVIEKPYCMDLFPKNLYTHCSHCLDVSWALIPCKCCINAAYCSENCKNKAWNEYHEVECLVLAFIENFDLNDLLRMGVRTTVKAIHNSANLNELKQVLIGVDKNTDPRTSGFSYDGKFHSDQYCSIYSLSNIADKKATEELIGRSFWVALTVYILARESKLFGKKLALDSLVYNPDVVFIGGLILRHVHILSTNRHGFGAQRSSNTSEHGTALMALGSLVNHSCNPNVLLQWYAGGQFMYATVPIEKGEQVFESYGPYFSDMEKSQRQMALSTTWNFKCECIACKENWPVLAMYMSLKDQQLCQENTIKIYRVMQELANFITIFVRSGTVNNLLRMLEMLSTSIEILCTLAKIPCQELNITIGMLQEFFTSADALYHYDPPSLPVDNTTYLLHYATIMHKLSQL